jgi:DNA-binding transcriptional ArsR family regulator
MTMVTTSTVAEIGSLLGDPARVNMMIALLDGRAWTARELADVAGVSPQTASSHLGKLVAAQLVRVDRQGRHRYHRLASSEVARLLEQMHVAGAAVAANRSPRPGPKDEEMRELRSCYDHLAGRIAVELSSRIIEPTAPVAGEAHVTREGASLLREIGVDVAALKKGRRAVCRACIDWSERRPHVAGAVGAAILDRLKGLGWVKPRVEGRSLILTATGERGLHDVFGISAVRSRA